MKTLWAVYFSGTGTTEQIVTAVARKMAEALKFKLKKYDFTLPAAREKELCFTGTDLVVFGVPVYAGRVPNVLLPYLLKVKGGGAAAIPIVLYGNRNYDDGLIELCNILEGDGFRTIAAAAFIGEHSFSKELAAGRPDAADLRIAEDFADRAVKKALGMTVDPVAVRGETPIRGYYQPCDRKGSPVDIRKVIPKTNKRCNNCGLCASVCPMGSISAQNSREITGICIKCGACIKKCPRQAKYYDDEGYLYHKRELELGYVRRAEPELFF